MLSQYYAYVQTAQYDWYKADVGITLSGSEVTRWANQAAGASGLDKNNPADAGFDPDKDGLNNLDEYRARTDHMDPASALIAAVEAPGGGLQLSWQSVPYVTYRVETRETLTAGDWSTVSGLENITAAFPTTTVALPAAADPSGFYRVVVK